MLSHVCATCKVSFVKPNNPNRPYKFCSYSCRAAAYKKDRLTANCEQCGVAFALWPFEAAKGRKTCSPGCASTARDKGRTTEAFRLRTSARYAEWRRAVFERDHYTCQTCGQKGGKLNADHIKRFSDHPELRLDVGNGRTLCVPCHLATDTFGNRRQARGATATGTEA